MSGPLARNEFRAPISYLLLPALLPAAIWFLRRLDDGSDEPLGLIALALALLLAWRDRHSLEITTRARTSGALLILASVLTISHLPPMLRAALAVAGIGIWFGMNRKPGLLGLLGLSLPVIASLQFYAGYPMRLAAAGGAVALLQLAGAMVSAEGVNIQLNGQLVCVDPACSGIRMLWHALAATMALCAIHRTPWSRTLTAGFLAMIWVIAANIVRAAWLAMIESGKHAGFDPGHENVGLICFAVVLLPLWMFTSKSARPSPPATPSAPPQVRHIAILSSAGALALFFLIQPPATAKSAPFPPHPIADFTFNGLTLPLDPLPLTKAEHAFTRGFPGSLSSHRCGENQVILRRVTTATRKLHPSRDCLRAAGFETTNATTVRTAEGDWARFTATRNGERLIVHERIVSEQDGSTWTDAAAWFWSALRHPLNGPWRAETVISR
jgi:exosortase/archaeosortase family protein